MSRTAAKPSLRTGASLQVLEGFGRAVSASCRVLAPRDVTELRAMLKAAAAEGLPVTFRGAGRSYGDASLNSKGIVFDMTSFRRLLHWDAAAGIAEFEPGLTVEDLWRRTIEDGYWPPVVPGTMRPTFGGILAMNVHGKNAWKVGPIGEHVLDFDLVTADGELLTCSREQNVDVFHAAIGGMGLLGAFTRIRLQMKKVESGLLQVTPIVGNSLEEVFDLFEENLGARDYLVAWVDCMVSGKSLGRGVLHAANYLHGVPDSPAHRESFHVEKQGLPPTIMGLPRSILWHFMAPFLTNFGTRCTNAVKFALDSWKGQKAYLQSHVGFAFLLDYVPNWRLAYGAGGFIQYQVFLPHAHARTALSDILKRCLAADLPPYLGVLKRHRPDPFLLTHGLDGWSFAMDFKVTADNRALLWDFTHELSEAVLALGGRFYMAKDGVLKADQAKRFWGGTALATFAALRNRLDPQRRLGSDMASRLELR